MCHCPMTLCRARVRARARQNYAFSVSGMMLYSRDYRNTGDSMMFNKIGFTIGLGLAVTCTTIHATPLDNTQQLKSIQQTSSDKAAGNEVVMFTPPAGWRNADVGALPEHVKVMVVGKGSSEFPPSITLGTEDYKGSLKQYLKRIKEINSSQGFEWKDLGTVRTEAGNASLSQVDKRTEWGDVRMMHVIMTKNGVVYILTAASLKEEFPKFYKDFFNSMRSLRFGEASSYPTAYN